MTLTKTINERSRINTYDGSPKGGNTVRSVGIFRNCMINQLHIYKPTWLDPQFCTIPNLQVVMIIKDLRLIPCLIVSFMGVSRSLVSLVRSWLMDRAGGQRRFCCLIYLNIVYLQTFQTYLVSFKSTPTIAIDPLLTTPSQSCMSSE